MDGLPEVLIRFKNIVGVGRISGPVRIEGREDLYRWVASSRSDVLATFRALAPWLGRIKRREFERAVEFAVPAVEWESLSSDERLMWAAGLFDGEGWTGPFEYSSHPGYYSVEMAVTQRGDDGPPEVLVRYLAVAGHGRIYGPYRGERGPIYRWRTFGLRNVEAVLVLLEPRLGSVKRRQAHAIRSLVTSQPPLARGNPTWGAHKTHCVRGHDYAAARLRPYRARSENGVVRRPSKQCLVCSREQARARRAIRRAES
jgi:hypothetical protein